METAALILKYPTGKDEPQKAHRLVAIQPMGIPSHFPLPICETRTMKKHFRYGYYVFGVLLALSVSTAWAAEPINIGSRRELMVDDYLIEQFEDGARLELHHPTAREVVLKYDQPWDGDNGHYHTAFKDGDIYRLYYLTHKLIDWDANPPRRHPDKTLYACYAESSDGIHWTQPELGIVEYNGSKKNNIFWTGVEAHDFSPFKDTNPDCKADAKYKAVGCGGGSLSLAAFKSPDGIHWEKLQDEPIITGHAFDSQNQAFWDPLEKQYRCYFREGRNGLRDIMVSTSKNFVDWTEPQYLEYSGCPPEQLYTNVISRYDRAPQFFVGFPARYVQREWLPSHDNLPDLEARKIRSTVIDNNSLRYGTVVTDGLFMSSRDGLNFHRWGEAFIRPGPQRHGNWLYGDGYQCMGLFETPSDRPGAENELSFYVNENVWMPDRQLRRYTIRIDGFVSVNAPRAGGGFVTKPLVFDGKELEMNFSSSAAGSIRVEIQDVDGKPIEGFTLADADETFGDTLARAATWQGESDVGSLAGRPVRLRFVMSDADLYSFRFKK